MGHVDHTQARRLTRIAQGAALLLVGGVVGAAVLSFGPSDATEPVSTGWPTSPEETGAVSRPDATPYVDIEYTKTLLDTIGQIKAPAEPDPTDEPAEPERPRPTGDTIAGGQRYLGGLFVGDRAFAVIGTPTGQHTLRVGDTVPGTSTEVVSIARDSVELDSRGERTTLERQAPERAQITQMSPELAGASERPLSRAEQNAARRNRLTRPDGEAEDFRAEVERRRDALRRQRSLTDDEREND